MFKKVQILDQVKSFQVNEHICYIHEQKGIVCSNAFEYPLDSKGSLYLISDKLIFQSFRGELKVIDINKKNCLFVNDIKEYKLFIDSRTSLIEGNSIYVSRKMKIEEYGILNFHSGAFKSLGEGIGLTIPELEIVLNWGGEIRGIEAKEFNSKEILWSFDELNQFVSPNRSKIQDKIKNYIGINNKSIWFSLSSGNLIVIDAKTGSLKQSIGFKESNLPTSEKQVCEGDYLPYGEFMQLDENQNQIFGLRDQYFMQVDLNQKELKREYINVGKSMAIHKISSSFRNYTFPYDKELIYFCDDRQGKIGIFDREKKEVIWSYELDMDQGGIAQILEMKYADNRLYVLDRNNSLHIFEKV